jgi:GNAT superfamily N-acetyltransferase
MRLGEPDLDGAVEILADAFGGYPVMRHILHGSGDFAGDLEVLLRFFASARFLREEPVLGAVLEDGLTGVALVSFPDAASPPALARYRADVWQSLGAAAEDRYEKFGEATAPFFRGLASIHLNMIGVRTGAQGRGAGRALLEAVTDLARGREGTVGVTLTTEVRSNVDLYVKFGYEVIGHARVAPDLETWGMLRRNRP